MWKGRGRSGAVKRRASRIICESTTSQRGSRKQMSIRGRCVRTCFRVWGRRSVGRGWAKEDIEIRRTIINADHNVHGSHPRFPRALLVCTISALSSLHHLPRCPLFCSLYSGTTKNSKPHTCGIVSRAFFRVLRRPTHTFPWRSISV